MNDPVQTRVPWTRVVELAKQLEAVFVERQEVQLDVAFRLARLVLEFQNQLLGESVRRTPPRVARNG
jgi:hypothetical protein